MKIRILALVCLLSPALLAAQEAPAAAPSEVVVLKAARLFEGKGETAVRNGVVIVEGGKIRATGSGLAVPAGARVIDLGDATLLPGLIDAHTHLAWEFSENFLQATVSRLRRTTAEAALQGAKVAIRAGVDSIEHGTFLDDEAWRMMKERGTYFVPTLLPGEYVARQAAAGQLPPELAEKARAAAAARAATFRKAVEAGVKIAFGTDAAVIPHGKNAQEFALMVQFGMSPAAALRAATSAAADLLGLAQRIGTLEPGKEADVIAVTGDPLADIHTMERVEFVMKGGRIYRYDDAMGARQ